MATTSTGPPLDASGDVRLGGMRRSIFLTLITGALLAFGTIAVGILLSSAEGFPSIELAVSTPRALWANGALGPIFLFLGLLVLVLTPVARVAMSAGIFVRAGDRTYTALTIFVLSLLLLTIVIGTYA